ncbi:ASCH domain-containing protein [Lacticaseibacillus absianus]|uniref:ASCH domain-containing protein n=1 Tax=Lacticaseibacillus absianus TaxID=2729623 RepID=UPI0015C6ED5F|nr:ASCH domain-containing protein [Lacticaseibacillus absianus]
MDPETYFAHAQAAGVVLPTAQMSSAYAFGATPAEADTLAALVVAGTKTATTSALAFYQRDHEPLPAVGELDVILDGQARPVAITVTTAVTVVSYATVPASHAFAEGEADRTLTSWRTSHDAFFAAAFAAIGQPFDPTTALVVLEEFRVLYH